MKPYRWIVTALVSSAASVPLVGITTEDRGRNAANELLLASLSQNRDAVWVPVRDSVTIEELSQQLSEDESHLARLNATNEDHRFQPGDWFALPARKSAEVARVASLDLNGLTSSLPVLSPPPVAAVGSGLVRMGDTLMTLAQRYGLSLADLLRLNPELESSRLVVGSRVRLAPSRESAPVRARSTLAIKPSGSGGVSWPDTPNYGPDAPGGFRTSSAWIWPTKGVFTSGYGWRWGRMHKGIDVANNVGTPIVAAASGRITYSGWHDGGYGYLVEITHNDGSTSLYAHNSRILVRMGETVEQGQTISQMGSTGRSTGPHLHFEIHKPGRGAINPLQILPPRA